MSDSAVEPVEPAAAGGAGTGAETEPVAGAAETASVEAPATPEINWDDLNVINEAARRIQALGYQIAPAEQPEPQPEPTESEYEPFSPESVQRLIDAKVQAALDQMTQQFQPVNAYVQAQQAEQTATLIDGRIEAAVAAAELNPDGFEHPGQLHDAVNAVANQLAAARLQELGRQPYGDEARKLGDACITDAVSILKAFGDARASAGVEAYKQSLSEAGHRFEPGVRGAGIEAAPEYTSELDVARRWTASR